MIVATRNEAANLPACLRSVAAFDEVFVVDSGSTDGTVRVAEEAGATVVQFAYAGGWPKKRNWAIEALPLGNEWVLILDADERVSERLSLEIREAIQRPGYDGFFLRWKFVFLGRWMRHSWSHGWMARLFRKGCGAYEDLGMRGEGGWDAEVHENIVVEGNVGKLKTPLLHESSEDLTYWIAKQNEFSSWNAARRLHQSGEGFPPLRYLFSRNPRRRRTWLKALYIRLPFRTATMFWYLYVVKLGFLDGIEGYFFCRLRAIHEFNTTAKIFELRQRRDIGGGEAETGSDDD